MKKIKEIIRSLFEIPNPKNPCYKVQGVISQFSRRIMLVARKEKTAVVAYFNDIPVLIKPLDGYRTTCIQNYTHMIIVEMGHVNRHDVFAWKIEHTRDGLFLTMQQNDSPPQMYKCTSMWK